MRIDEYYRDTANLNLNGSIASLIPTALIVSLNLYYFQIKEIMLLTIPFIIYSLISFQIYLFRKKQSIAIGKNMIHTVHHLQSLFKARQLLIVFLNTYSRKVLLFFPDGHLAGEIKRFPRKKTPLFKNSKAFVFADHTNHVLGYFEIKRTGKRKKMIRVYDSTFQYIGCYEKTRDEWLKSKKELLDEAGRFIGAVEGSPLFMDEHILDKTDKTVGRLQRGLMPLEWSKFFPEPNTPVLTFSESLTSKDRLLRMSFLINEYFIER